jgi:hypothetical protein
MLPSTPDALIDMRSSRSGPPSVVTETLARFGDGAVRRALRAGIRVVPMRRGERYDRLSPALRRLGIDVDAWPSPPSGLFVVEERTIYLRSRSPLTIAHEFGHALDCALGCGVYLSGTDARIRRCYERANGFVTPYAATALDEYFAESLRAYVGINDPFGPWPPVDRALLRRIDPGMHDYVRELYAREFACACMPGDEATTA